MSIFKEVVASSSALDIWVAVSGRVGGVGGLLFRTHSEQRVRASRGQKLLHDGSIARCMLEKSECHLDGHLCYP